MTGIAAPWLSVVLPTYHGELWLDRTLASLAAEPDPGIEVVVIDTSRSSGTMDIVRGFADRLAMTIVDSVGVDGCMPKTNLGVARAAAEHVAWLCQDDLWLPGRVAAVRRWIDAAPNASLHLAPNAIIDRDCRVRGIWRCPLDAHDDAPLDRDMLLERLLVQNFVGVPSSVFRRDAWLACGGLDESLWYTGDWDVWIKLAASGPVVYHEEVTAAFRIHDEAQTVSGSRDPDDFARQQLTVVERHIPMLPAARRASVRRLAETSIAVNGALASAGNGAPGSALRALGTIIALGPVQTARYFHRSRIIDRLAPRVRARLAGVF